MQTTCSGVELESNGKFSVTFTTVKGQMGDEYVSSSCTSAPVFDSEDEAYNGAIRALDVLAATGRFPNMCEQF
jgi:hypothetical protein